MKKIERPMSAIVEAPILSMEEGARYVGLSRATFYRLVDANVIPAYGKPKRIYRKDVDAAMLRDFQPIGESSAA